MFDPSVDVAGDMAALNAGRFTQSGNNFVVNGRTYGWHPETGRTYPISGPGIVPLDRAQHTFLRNVNSQGLERAMQTARHQPGLSDAAIETVLELLRRCP